MKKLLFWQKKRYLSHIMVLFLFFLIPTPLPFFEKGFLKIDFDQWKIFLFGFTLPKEHFYLFFLLFLLGILALFIFSYIYGKVFCGWICPQNIYFEFLDNVHKKLKKRFPSYRKNPKKIKLVDLGLTCIFAALTSWNLNRYFVGLSPIFSAYLTIAPFCFFVFLVHVFKHRFCQSTCPLAMFQKSVQTNHSLHVSYDSSRNEKPCGVCYSCERACYVNIDIKKTPFHMDCTLCGACVDACARVYQNKNESPLLNFSFLKEKTLLQKLGLDRATSILSLIFFVVCLGLYSFAVVHRPLLSTYLSPLKTKNASPSHSYSLLISNLSPHASQYKLLLSDPNFIIEAKALDQDLSLEAFERKMLQFQIQFLGEKDPELKISPLSLVVYDEKDSKISQETLFYYHHN